MVGPLDLSPSRISLAILVFFILDLTDDLKTSRIAAQFDYTMPLNKELRDLAKTPVQIFRVEK